MFKRTSSDRRKTIDHLLLLGVDIKAVDSVRALPLARAWYRDATGDLEHAGERTQYTLALDSALVRSDDFATSTPVRALAKTLRQESDVENWAESLTRALVDEAHLADGSWVVSLDPLADNIREGWEQLRSQPLQPSSRWAYEVAGRLDKIAFPVFNREERLTADSVIAIRIAALCLAGEFDRYYGAWLGDIYREIAAGITLMERRSLGMAPATETIMLAMA